MARTLLVRIEGASSLNALRWSCGPREAHGFDGAEWAVPPGAAPPTAEPDRVPPPSAAETGCQALPPRVLSVVCGAPECGETVENVVRWLEAARSVGAELLSLRFRDPHGTPDGMPSISYQDALRCVHKLLRAARPEAEANGVALALEPASGGCFLSPTEARDAVDAVNSWAVGVCLDVERIAPLGSPADWVRILLRRVKSVRFSSARVLDAGAIGDLVSALSEAHFEGPIVVPVSGVPFASLDVLRARPCIPPSRD